MILVRPTGTPLRKAASSLRADGVDGEAEPRALAAGSRRCARQTSSSSSALGIQALIASGRPGIGDGADDQRLQPFGRAAAGRVEHQQRGALQHEQHGQRHDDVGHAGDDDQDAVERAEHEAQQRARTGTTSSANSSLAPFISRRR